MPFSPFPYWPSKTSLEEVLGSASYADLVFLALTSCYAVCSLCFLFLCHSELLAVAEKFFSDSLQDFFFFSSSWTSFSSFFPALSFAGAVSGCFGSLQILFGGSLFLFS